MTFFFARPAAIALSGSEVLMQAELLPVFLLATAAVRVALSCAIETAERASQQAVTAGEIDAMKCCSVAKSWTRLQAQDVSKADIPACWKRRICVCAGEVRRQRRVYR